MPTSPCTIGGFDRARLAAVRQLFDARGDQIEAAKHQVERARVDAPRALASPRRTALRADGRSARCRRSRASARSPSGCALREIVGDDLGRLRLRLSRRSIARRATSAGRAPRRRTCREGGGVQARDVMSSPRDRGRAGPSIPTARARADEASAAFGRPARRAARRSLRDRSRRFGDRVDDQTHRKIEVAQRDQEPRVSRRRRRQAEDRARVERADDLAAQVDQAGHVGGAPGMRRSRVSRATSRSRSAAARTSPGRERTPGGPTLSRSSRRGGGLVRRSLASGPWSGTAPWRRLPRPVSCGRLTT